MTENRQGCVARWVSRQFDVLAEAELLNDMENFCLGSSSIKTNQVGGESPPVCSGLSRAKARGMRLGIDPETGMNQSECLMEIQKPVLHGFSFHVTVGIDHHPQLMD